MTYGFSCIKLARHIWLSNFYRFPVVFLLVFSMFLSPLFPAYSADSDMYVTEEVDKGFRHIDLPLNKSIILKLPRPGRDVIIGNDAIVDAVLKTRDKIYLFARTAGQTNLFVTDDAGATIANLEINVSFDMVSLMTMFDRLIPGHRLQAASLNDSVVLSGQVSSATDMRRAVDLARTFTGRSDEGIVNAISISGSQQVMLKVRVVEIQRTTLKALGVDTEAVLASGQNLFQIASLNPFTVTNLALGSGVLNRGTEPTLNNGIAARGTVGDATIGGSLRAFERDGILHTLAEPVLTTVSGEGARFLAGGEFPIPVSEDNDRITVDYKEFGVALGFTPVVLSDGLISLQIETEVSEITNEVTANLGPNLTVPSLKVRRTSTTVETPSGGSLVISGLIQDRLRQDVNGLPGLKDIPVLGQIFRSSDYRRDETELAVFVTPILVNSVSESRLAVPGTGFSPSNDAQTILFGKLNRVYGTSQDGARRDGASGTWHGEAGYIIE